jgi:hypothetical protein
MTTHSLPPEFDLPPERFQAQRRLLVTTVASQRRRARVVRPRLVFLAAALLLAVLLVTPAFGIGSRLVHAFTACPVSRCGSPPSSPSEAQKQTGVAPTTHLRTDYDGVDYSVVTYKDAQGRLCVASLASSGEAGYGCDQAKAQFAKGSLVALLGPSWMQEPNRPGFDPTLWDRMWLDGLTKPAVVRLDVVMTDCSTRPVSLDRDSFDGYGVFLYTVPRDDLHAGIWPYKLVAYDDAGNPLSSQIIPRDVPATPAAHAAHTRAPQPLSACR